MHYTNAFIRGKKTPFRGVFKYMDGEGSWLQVVRTLKAEEKGAATLRGDKGVFANTTSEDGIFCRR